TPVAPDPEVVKAAAEQLKLEPTTKKVVDINDADPKKGRKAAIAMLEAENLPTTEENIFIAASCKEKGILYLTGKSKVNGVRKADPKEAEAKAKGEYTVTVNGKAYGVKLDKANATVNGVAYPINVAYGIDEEAVAKTAATAPAAAPAAAAAPVAPGAGEKVVAPMPGLVLRVEVKQGQAVKSGQLVMVMEAMKMENEIFAPCDGTVSSISVSQGQQLQSGDVLMTIA
nr:biotin/lipoyl-binding protein [Sphaerochaetaceae bacterium]